MKVYIDHNIDKLIFELDFDSITHQNKVSKQTYKHKQTKYKKHWLKNEIKNLQKLCKK